MYFFREISRADAHLLRNMAVAGTQCKKTKLQGILRRFAAGIRRRAAIKHLKPVQPAHSSEIIFQTAVIIAEGMRRKAHAALRLYQVDEILRRDTFLRVFVDPERHDIPLQREELDPYKDRESRPGRVFRRILLKSHAVMVGNTDPSQSFLSCNTYHLIQFQKTVF